MNQSKELQVKEKKEVQSPGEQTRYTLVFTPATDIYETENDLVLLADLPGVKEKDLKIDLDNDILTIIGDVEESKGKAENFVAREYRTGRYYRQFTTGETINREKINATLNDGVLKLVMPKEAKAKPRKIEIKTG